MSVNTWANIIETSLKKREEKVEKGFLTMKQLQKEWSLSLSQVNKRVGELRATGLIIEKSFRLKRGNKTYPIPHYKIK